MKKVLLVDDDEVIRFAVKRVLEHKAEYDVMVADSGEAGLEAIRNHRPDVVLLDFGMPGMNGVEFMRAAKEVEGASNVPVVVITGASPQDAEMRELAEYTDAFLQKPINGQMLKEAIEFVTGRKDL